MLHSTCATTSPPLFHFLRSPVEAGKQVGEFELRAPGEAGGRWLVLGGRLEAPQSQGANGQPQVRWKESDRFFLGGRSAPKIKARKRVKGARRGA